MTTRRTAVHNLLQERMGQWVTRADIESVGGYEAMRRLREVRRQVRSFGLLFETRTDPQTGLLEYRVTRPLVSGPRWACQKCGRLAAPDSLQPSIDPRWRLAHCPICRRSTVYQEVTP